MILVLETLYQVLYLITHVLTWIIDVQFEFDPYTLFETDQASTFDSFDLRSIPDNYFV